MNETDLKPARVLLIGMMGSGKTAVGHALSRATGWPFLDNDDLVKRATGIVTRDVLNTHGEKALRDAEAAALGEALAITPPIIAGVAGGVVSRAEDLPRLRDGGFVVWLRARIETLLARVGTGSDRPWLSGDPEGAMRRLYEGREPRYKSVATVIIDVDDATPNEISRRIVAAVRDHYS
jgi:shikimate kinase